MAGSVTVVAGALERKDMTAIVEWQAQLLLERR